MHALSTRRADLTSDPATSLIGCIRGVVRARARADLSAFTSLALVRRVRDSSSTFHARLETRQYRRARRVYARMLRYNYVYSAKVVVAFINTT